MILGGALAKGVHPIVAPRIPGMFGGGCHCQGGCCCCCCRCFSTGKGLEEDVAVALAAAGAIGAAVATACFEVDENDVCDISPATEAGATNPGSRCCSYPRGAWSRSSCTSVISGTCPPDEFDADEVAGVSQKSSGKS